MSAAEKLKALDQRARRADDQSLSRERRRQLALSSGRAVLNALPQIVAVVEAAEDGRVQSVLLSSEPWEMVGWHVEKAQALNTALAALDEALT